MVLSCEQFLVESFISGRVNREDKIMKGFYLKNLDVQYNHLCFSGDLAATNKQFLEEG